MTVAMLFKSALGRLWMALALVILLSFGVLSYFGGEIYQYAPPVPVEILSISGEVVFTGDQIHRGQDVWRSIGGQELGSIWGHGAYTAPDWTADWLHREAIWLLDEWSREQGVGSYADLGEEQQAGLQARVQAEMRRNSYDEQAQTITLSPLRARAVQAIQGHYVGLFGHDPTLDQLRENYAMPADTVMSPASRVDLTEFFFWASWASITERPGREYTYTSNWPPDELIGAHIDN